MVMECIAAVLESTKASLVAFPVLLAAPTLEATLIWAVFIGFLVLCYYIVPGKVSRGVELKNGTRLEYPVNGMSSFLLLIALFYGGVYTGHWKATIIYDNFWPLFTVSNIFAFTHATLLYIRGRFLISAEQQAQEHRQGSFIMNYFLGMELNPRVLGLDLKYFAYRPLIMGWAMIVLSMAHKQFAVHNVLSIPMALYVLFTWTYTIDYLWQEQKICTTWDVIAENFGWQLVWGDYTFYPFFYSIQGHFLIKPTTFPPYVAIGIMGVFFLGYYIFRSANNQKDLFKRIGTKAKIWGKPVRTTKDGRLLMSGWWGIGRHINYCGDILIAVGWTLPCGFSSLVPWFHSMFFVPFLLHREHRDEQRMRGKYKATYEEYCKVAKWRVFPYIY